MAKPKQKVQSNKPTPFTFVESISRTKQDIWSEETKAAYIPFIINRQFSYFLDTVLYANDMNMNGHLTNHTQYMYFLSSVPRRARFSKWARKADDDVVSLVMTAYQCSAQKAEEIIPLLDDAQLQELAQIYAGTTNERPRNK